MARIRYGRDGISSMYVLKSFVLYVERSNRARESIPLLKKMKLLLGEKACPVPELIAE
jgi:hypothetical protein